jgi:release factor glutamine methyltransferase
VTAAESVDAAADLLVAAGFGRDDARRDAGVLLRHLHGWSLGDWAARAREPLEPGLAAQLLELVRKRARHEPIAYITGSREFYGRDFHVTPAVLIPRPETEAIVDVVISGSADSAVSILDVGTGSGCLAVTLALELPGSHVIASDTSADALDVARDNARALGAASVDFLEASLVPAGIGSLDWIVSNPPYVPERDRVTLAADVRDFEPAEALFAGPDGLDVIRELIPAAHAALKPGATLVFEIGAGQSETVSKLVAAGGLELRTIQRDLQGIPRTVIARRPGPGS